MTNFKIVFTGECPSKKNARKQAFTRKDKATGVFKPLKFPISYYSKTYRGWAWQAVQKLYVWKQKNMELKKFEFPLSGQYVCSILFFRSTMINLTGEKGKGKGQTIDLQNLYDSVLDVFAGNSGLQIPKKFKMEHTDYKILADDSFAFIKSHGASYIFQDVMNPRTEIFVSDFNEQNHWKVFKMFHPDLEIGYIPEEPLDLFKVEEPEFNLNEFMNQ